MLHLGHGCRLHGGNPSDSLCNPLSATMFDETIEQSSSGGLCEYDTIGGYMHRRDVDDGRGFLNRIWLTIVRHCISVHTISIACIPMISL
jgi:hypothetical protein